MTVLLIGYCRICQEPILQSGPTCSHIGYLIWQPFQTYWRGRDGSTEHQRSMSPLGHYTGDAWPTDSQSCEAIILDLLEHIKPTVVQV